MLPVMAASRLIGRLVPPLKPPLSCSVGASADVVDGDGVIGFIEEHAVVADAKPEQTLELAAQWLDVSLARLGIVMEGLQNA